MGSIWRLVSLLTQLFFWQCCCCGDSKRLQAFRKGTENVSLSPWALLPNHPIPFASRLVNSVPMYVKHQLSINCTNYRRKQYFLKGHLILVVQYCEKNLKIRWTDFLFVDEQYWWNLDMLGQYANSFGCLDLNNISGYEFAFLSLLNSECRLAETNN